MNYEYLKHDKQGQEYLGKYLKEQFSKSTELSRSIDQHSGKKYCIHGKEILVCH